MPANVARNGFVFILIHWVLVLMSVVLLGLGWYINYIKYIPQEPQARSFLFNLHISLGLTSAILLSIQIVLKEFPKWRKLLVYTLYRLIYVSFTLMLISGYLHAVFTATPIQFWGTPLPVWGAPDVVLAGSFGAMHRVRGFCIGRIDFCSCLYRCHEYI